MDLVTEIEHRLQTIFQAYHQGFDVAPAFQFRTEGLIEAALLQGLFNDETIADLMNDIHQQVFEKPLELTADQPWQIPTLMKRAPVR